MGDAKEFASEQVSELAIEAVRKFRRFIIIAIFRENDSLVRELESLRVQ